MTRQRARGGARPSRPRSGRPCVDAIAVLAAVTVLAAVALVAASCARVAAPAAADRAVTAGGTTTASVAADVAASNAADRAPHAAHAAPAQVRAVTAVAMTVADADRSTAFFTDVLGFTKVSDVVMSGAPYARLWGLVRPYTTSERREAARRGGESATRGGESAMRVRAGESATRVRAVRLRLGREALELLEITPRGRPYPADSRSNDRWFQHVAIVVADMDAAYRRVRSRVRPISVGGPQTLPASNVAAAGISAFYFRDPDGHALELIHFPPGKGDPRWRRKTRGRLFLGIDHTAIGVRDTAASLAFYRDLLGLAVVGESVNAGTAQEHLTGVDGARVRITGLRAPGPVPGIELLDYRAPTNGRDAPADARTNDLLHWHATVAVADVDAAARALRAAGHPTRSHVVRLPDATLGFTRAVMVRDPDGHAVQLVDAATEAPAGR